MNNPCTQCAHAEHYPRGKTGNTQYNLCTKQGCDKLLKYQEYLVSKRKYKQGEPIFSLDDLLLQQFVYIFGGIKHIEVVKHLQLSTILSAIKRGGIHKAIKKDRGN